MLAEGRVLHGNPVESEGGFKLRTVRVDEENGEGQFLHVPFLRAPDLSVKRPLHHVRQLRCQRQLAALLGRCQRGSVTKHYQKALSEFDVYHPTDSEKDQGNWAVVFEQLDCNGEPDPTSNAHIIPTFDPIHHRISASCWCGAKLNEDGMIVHGVSQ